MEEVGRFVVVRFVAEDEDIDLNPYLYVTKDYDRLIDVEREELEVDLRIGKVRNLNSDFLPWWSMNGLFDSTTGEGLAESGWLPVFIKWVLAAFLDPVRIETP